MLHSRAAALLRELHPLLGQIRDDGGTLDDPEVVLIARLLVEVVWGL